MSEITCPCPAERPGKKRRVPREPRARFKEDDAAVLKMAEAMVPQEHLSRRVLELMERMDLSQVEAQYSALGQRGYRPRGLLAVWVYASLIGVHHATKLARALSTDMALRLLTGGHAISRPVLNRFRMRQGALFAAALEQTVTWAVEEKRVDAQALAVDSVRLRAHAALRHVRVLKRSKRRLEELAQVEVGSLPEPERLKHQQKVDKHTQAVELCTQANAASVVLTSPAAALMQFPGNVYLPGHRVTVTASGAQSRLVVGVLINKAPNDAGLLEQAVLQARTMLSKAGLPRVSRLQAAADAGYWSHSDLAFAAQNTGWLDMLVEEKSESGPLRGKGKPFFSRDAFRLLSPERVVCPAGTPMVQSKHDKAQGTHVYLGDGCSDCPLRRSCTSAERRHLVINWDYEKLRTFMRERMKRQGARARYYQRMATVEPVFSWLEDGMGFRRVSSRHPLTVHAEILLKLLAHNISRLLGPHRPLCVYFLLPLGAPLQALTLLILYSDQP